MLTLKQILTQWRKGLAMGHIAQPSSHRTSCTPAGTPLLLLLLLPLALLLLLALPTRAQDITPVLALPTPAQDITPADGSADNALVRILRQVEAHNPDLKAHARQTAAEKLDNRADNNLDDPTLEYAHVWDRDDGSITQGELIVSQAFDFPTLYAARARRNRLRAGALDAEAQAYRQQVLLQAEELCLDIIRLQQTQSLLDRRLRLAEDLTDAYDRRLQAGEASVLEANKIHLELLNARTLMRRNQSELAGKLKALTAMAGGEQLAPGRTLPGYAATPTDPAEHQLVNVGIDGLDQWPLQPLPDDAQALVTQLLAEDPALKALDQQTQAAHRQLSASRQGWLPRLEVGYRRNTESGHPLNGVHLGLSIPLWNNRGRVKQARALEQQAGYRQLDARQQVSAALWQLCDEAASLQAAINEYDQTLAQQQDLDLLRQALDGGQISLTEYLLSADAVHDSLQALLDLQHQYHLTMARLYRARL